MLEPLTNTLQNVVNFTWPMIIISVVIMVSFRICFLIKNKTKVVLYKEISMLIFAVYILTLFQVVTFQDDVTWSSNNFIPFREILRYNITSRLFFKNVLGNMLMFLPFGLFTSYFLKVEKPHLPIILTIIASISIEIVQMIIGRVFDVDDILLNIIGGLLGYILYKILHIVKRKLPSVCRNEWFLNTVSIIVLIGLISLIIIIL